MNIDMAEKTLEELSEKEQVKMVFGWLSMKIGNMANTLYELHKANHVFQNEFNKKKDIIERQLYELRGRDYKAYRT